MTTTDRQEALVAKSRTLRSQCNDGTGEHHGRALQILEQRQRTLQDAWTHNPERFVHGPPNPQALPKPVWINPPTEAKTSPDAH